MMKTVADFLRWYPETKKGFAFRQDGRSGLFFIPDFEATGLVTHAFTSRLGGVSTGSYRELNMSWSRYDDLDGIYENYRIVCRDLGISEENLVCVHGNHGVVVKRVGEQNRGDGFLKPYSAEAEYFDGMWTDTPNVCMSTVHADCTPVYFLDPVQKIVCLCHSGWRGTVDGIIKNATGILMEQGCDPANILAAIGPCIKHCCFEVHADVKERVEAAYPGLPCIQPAEQKGKFHVDILMCAAYDLYLAGIRADHVTIADLCTCCSEDIRHSFRRDNRLGGAMSAFLQLNREG